MALSLEFQNFVSSWQKKADGYDDNDLGGCFDKFFTLYVTFNRIYAEATFLLSRKGQIKIARRGSFPDAKAATAYTLQFLGAKHFVSEIMTDSNSVAALKKIIKRIKDESFNIKLNMVTGDEQRDRDVKLLEDLESKNLATKGRAILETIYSVRCNMFHGHKGFHGVQIEILQPIIILLKRTITIALDKLQRGDD